MDRMSGQAVWGPTEGPSTMLQVLAEGVVETPVPVVVFKEPGGGVASSTG